MSDYYKLLVILDELADIFTKEAERWVRDDNVCLLEQFNALGAAEVAVAFEFVDSDLLGTRHTVAVPITEIFKPDRGLAVVPAEQIHILILVAGCDKFLKSKKLKVIGEIVKEIADSWVITVAKDCLALEMFPVMPQLILDVRKLGVELIFLRALSLVKVIVPGHND